MGDRRSRSRTRKDSRGRWRDRRRDDRGCRDRDRDRLGPAMLGSRELFLQQQGGVSTRQEKDTSRKNSRGRRSRDERRHGDEVHRRSGDKNDKKGKRRGGINRSSSRSSSSSSGSSRGSRSSRRGAPRKQIPQFIQSGGVPYVSRKDREAMAAAKAEEEAALLLAQGLPLGHLIAAKAGVVTSSATAAMAVAASTANAGAIGGSATATGGNKSASSGALVQGIANLGPAVGTTASAVPKAARQSGLPPVAMAAAASSHAVYNPAAAPPGSAAPSPNLLPTPASQTAFNASMNNPFTIPPFVGNSERPGTNYPSIPKPNGGSGCPVALSAAGSNLAAGGAVTVAGSSENPARSRAALRTQVQRNLDGFILDALTTSDPSKHRFQSARGAMDRQLREGTSRGADVEDPLDAYMSTLGKELQDKKLAVPGNISHTRETFGQNAFQKLRPHGGAKHMTPNSLLEERFA
ncbi:unnamed protein product [Amoebophrya sp. A25]|nr:unnamed protein product [Amoebophrya sp. A25]|eukprot:GSA25T00017502001.1